MTSEALLREAQEQMEKWAETKHGIESEQMLAMAAAIRRHLHFCKWGRMAKHVPIKSTEKV